MTSFVYALVLTVIALPLMYVLLKKQIGGGTGSLDECLDANLELEQEVADKMLQLQEALEENRMLIETSVDAIILVNEERRITGWNDAASGIFGYAREEAVGQYVDMLIPEKYRAAHLNGFNRYLKSAEVKVLGKTTELEAVRKDGTVIEVELSLSAHRSDEAHAIMAIIRDISVRKLAEYRMAHEVDVTKSLLNIVEATEKTVDIDGLLRRIVESVKGSMGCDYSLAYLWDREMKIFRPGESSGLSHEMLHLFKMESLTDELPVVKHVIKERSFAVEVLAPEDIPPELQATKDFYSWVDDLHTIAVIPLTGRRAYLGILVCVYTNSNPKISPGLTERDLEILHGISRHVSVVLEDARLYKDSLNRAMELSHKIETIQVMQEIDRSILSALESHEIMETAASMISRIIQCDRATIAIADRDKESFTYAAGFGIKVLPKGSVVAFKDTSGTEVMDSCISEYISNIHEVGELLSFEKTLKEEGFLSHIRAPIIVKGEGQGFLCIGSRRPSAFTPQDLSTLETLASQVGVALENSRLLKDIEELFIGTVRTLSEAIDAKSSWTRGHSERMTRLAIEIGKEMGLGDEELKRLELAGLLHDLGKIGTYESVLDKPEKLTAGEVTMIRSHPLDAARILAPIKQLRDVVPTIKAHHEFYDGHGYPEGLKGKDIPLLSRILGVADAVDAMGADRPYRKGIPMDEIVAELKRCSGSQLDPVVVEAFLRVQNRGDIF